MTSEEVLDIYRTTGALLTGHFLLSSGLHSDRYLQCALVLQNPQQAEALGAALAVVSVITKNEILLAIAGGIFVIEALSVMAQVASFKMTGKRVFKMAPIHHHFELKGWAEPKVIVRFWIISILLALLTLSTLKLR